MKNVLNKLISKNLIEPVLVIFGTIAIFQWVVTPGLSTDSTIINVLSGIIAVVSGLFVVLYVKECIFPSKQFTNISKEAETELDYYPVITKVTKKNSNKT
jgi:hypothetical protein